MKRVLVIGIDAADLDMIKPWVEENKLPNFARLLKEGAHGRLKSIIPPISPPAWTSFATGKNPGKHGIFDFTARKPNSYEVEFVNARWRKTATAWKIISDAGKRVCILSQPVSYPPEKIDGVMISGIDTPGATGGMADPTAIHPPELYNEIWQNVGPYLISPNLVAFKNDQCDEMVEAALKTVERKMETALYLYKKEAWDCFMIVVGETDGISHRLWRYHDKKSPLSDKKSQQHNGVDPILRIYQRVDEYLGRFQSLIDGETTMIIMSDHGHGGNSDKAVYLNRWLEEQNLLNFKKNKNENLSFLRRAILANLSLAKTIGLKFFPTALKKKILRKTNFANKMESMLRFSHIDWRCTQAYSDETPYNPHIWINVHGREPGGIVKQGKEYENLCDEIILRLSQWKDPETGNKVVKKAHRREDIYSGPFVERFPDLIIEWNLNNGYSYLFKNSKNINGSQAPISYIDEKEKEKSKTGDHRDYGIFIAKGNDVKRTMQINGAELIDLAPTILYLLNIPIPADMDGKVLTQIFEEGHISSHPIKYDNNGSGLDVKQTELHHNYSKDEEEALKERLQGLGYIE
jgi:predicted AlkP superfamily phosphohydrolase/phosphomutase